jgi:preprotein translocase subunit SecG
MEYLFPVLLALHILVGLTVIGLVLLQHGKGADMGAAFGSGASGSLFGATGSANFLSRTTAGLATVFFLTSLGLTYLASNRPQAPSSVMEAPGAPAAGAITVPLPGAGEQKPADTAAPAGAQDAAKTVEPSSGASAEQKPADATTAGGADAKADAVPKSEAPKTGAAPKPADAPKKAEGADKPAGAGDSKAKDIPR